MPTEPAPALAPAQTQATLAKIADKELHLWIIWTLEAKYNGVAKLAMLACEVHEPTGKQFQQLAPGFKAYVQSIKRVTVTGTNGEEVVSLRDCTLAASMPIVTTPKPVATPPVPVVTAIPHVAVTTSPATTQKPRDQN
jgi:hypothetical protein